MRNLFNLLSLTFLSEQIRKDLTETKTNLGQRQKEVDFLQTANNSLRSELFDKTKVQIDGQGLTNQNDYLIKANEELKNHLEEVCNQLESSLGENERLAGKFRLSDISQLDA